MKTTVVKVFNIDWDLDYDLGEEDPGLPTEMIIDFHPEYLEINGIEVGDYVADAISNITGFCHRNFEFEEIEEQDNVTD